MDAIVIVLAGSLERVQSFDLYPSCCEFVGGTYDPKSSVDLWKMIGV